MKMVKNLLKVDFPLLSNLVDERMRFMQDRVQYAERIIAFVGSIVSILGFSGLSAYALLGEFKEAAPSIGEKLLLSSGAFILSVIIGMMILLTLRMLFQVTFSGFKITDKDGNEDKYQTAKFHDFKIKIYVSASFIFTVISFVGLLLLIWSSALV